MKKIVLLFLLLSNYFIKSAEGEETPLSDWMLVCRVADRQPREVLEKNVDQSSLYNSLQKEKGDFSFLADCLNDPQQFMAEFDKRKKRLTDDQITSLQGNNRLGSFDQQIEQALNEELEKREEEIVDSLTESLREEDTYPRPPNTAAPAKPPLTAQELADLMDALQ